MNIVLIGYRGTGKSSVAAALSVRLGWPAISTDAEIVAREGKSIPDIVKAHGWEYFRDIESQVCRDVSGKDRVIIDTGGGAVLRAENVAALKAHGRLFWLTAEVPTIQARIGGDTGRPSLTGTKSFLDEITEVLAERSPKYRAAADHIIPTDSKKIREVVDAILALL
ncbi:shikimate kinase [Candidatus Nitrospira bockiana]